MTWTLVSAKEFASHAVAWDWAAQRTTAVPFLWSAFLVPLLAEFATGHELLALHGNPERPTSVAIVQPIGTGRWQTFQPSQLPLGAWISPSDADLVELAGKLLRTLPGLALSLGITQVDPELCPQPTANSLLRLQPYADTSYIDVIGSFDDYWDSRGKNLRQNTRKLRRRLLADGSVIHLDCVREPAEIPMALAQFAELEGAGWKAHNGTSVGISDAQGRFYRAALMDFCAKGLGRIYRYRINDRVAAMDICIDSGTLVVILKTAYDESLGHLSPAVLMREEVFKSWWLEGRYQRIEFYGRTMEWHTRWTEQHRNLYHATCFRLQGLRELGHAVARWPFGRRALGLRAAQPGAGGDA